MSHRLRWQIVLPYMVLMGVTIAALLVFGVTHIRRQEFVRGQEQLLGTAQLIADEAQVYYEEPGDLTALSNLADRTSQIFDLNITFLDNDGIILASTLPDAQQPASPLELPAVSGAISDGKSFQSSDSLMAAAAEVKSPAHRTLGIVQLQVPAEHFRMNLSRFWGLGLLLILSSALGIMILSLIVHDRSLDSIEALTINAQQMSLGQFDNLHFPDTSQELAGLSQAMQTMAEMIGTQIEALTSERPKLSAVLNQMTDGVLIADADGRVQLLNPTAQRLFQVDEETGLGRSLVEVMRYHQLVDLWRHSRNGQRQSTMLEIGPQHLFLQVVAIPLKSSLTGSTLLLFQDLTQLRRLETVRRDFISNVSHELRTPLASLKALAETLQEGALDDPPAARRFILRMETEIDNMTQLVNELLELSRIESGKVSLSFHRIHPYDLLQPAYERMVLQAERAGLELVMDCPPDLPPIFADPDRITQVVINLVHNAIKFTPPGGKITISAYQDCEKIVFFVRDTGIGIPKGDLIRVFERFYKADRARTGGGTGLGLSIARHMIESHGGDIWTESEVDIGTTIYFTLPVA